jgi:hypothetical protein
MKDFVLEIKELDYDRTKLIPIYEATKHLGRVKGLPWRSYDKSKVLSTDQAKCVVVQYGDHMMLDDANKNLSCNLLEFPYVKELVSKLNFNHEITGNNVDIIIYRPGFKFEPHTDGYSQSTLMWPIIPEDGGAPVDFYHRDDIEIKIPGEYKTQVSDKDIVYTHYYNTTCPTIFNSHKIHGVKGVQVDRAFLRLRLNETFESILEKYNTGRLIND